MKQEKGGLFRSRFMERRPAPRIVKLRLVSKHINARVQRTAEILSRICVKFRLFEMPSFTWLESPLRSSSKTVAFSLFPILFRSLIETWCRLPRRHSYPSPQGTLEWFNIPFTGATSDERMWSMWKEPGRTREENPVRSKRNGAIFCPAGSQNYSNVRIQPFRPKSPEPVGQSFGDAGSVPSTLGRRREYRRTAAGLSWSQVNYQDSGREHWWLAHNWLHQHANPLHFSWFLWSGKEFRCVIDHSSRLWWLRQSSHLYLSKFHELQSSWHLDKCVAITGFISQALVTVRKWEWTVSVPDIL